uniref:Reverse transcriptase zinc-binding domain-containing protein n=1 Tax=Aegilops tauschii subsp. strangulata TaxID=200361 RepID=A0A453GRB6_AEGTS
MHHLLVSCPFWRQVWHDTLSWLRMTCRQPDQDTSLNEWWLATKETTPKPLGKGPATTTLLMGG